MSNPRYLTKSRFKLAVECPTKLYYVRKSHEYRDSMAENDFLAMLAEGGYQVGALAKLRYPDGIEIEGLDTALTISETRELLGHKNVVLFEPAIQIGDFFIRIDILVKNGNRLELIEVKAKSYDSLEPGIEGKNGGITSSMLPYLQDAAFQTWLLRQAYPGSEITTSLMMPDKSKLAPINGINQMFKLTERSVVELRVPQGSNMKALAETLLTKVCVDNYISHILSQPLEYPGGLSSFREAANIWADAYRNDQKIAPKIGAQCGSCQFKAESSDGLKSGFHECWKAANDWNDQDFIGGTVLDLWNFRGKQKMIDQGTFRISQILREDIGDFDDESEVTGLSRKQRQWLQVNGIPEDYNHGGYYFDSSLAAVEMSSWKFPYHFIDFETSSVALPFYEGMRPYEPVAFQFSHHVMEADGSVRHAHQFLCAEPGEFPNYKFAQELKSALDKDDGTVFMWSHHENTILSKIILQLTEDSNRPEDTEDLISFIRCLIKMGDREMVDLCKIAEKTFFHPDTKGSNSIKKVLPAILKVSSVLRETYSKPIYGSPNGIQSLNFSSPSGFAWIDITEGSVADPYSRLKKYAEDVLPEDAEDKSSSIIAEGGAAATAYARLQFEDMDNGTRERIKSSLLRYCELDTLAMVMVVQGWRQDIRV